MSLVELLAIASVVCLLVALWTRPVGLFAVVFALAVVGTAVLVSWNDVQQARAERAASAAFQQQGRSAAVTVPAPNYPRAGS